MNAIPAVAKNVDLPMSGLLKDLNECGMLDGILVVWATMFGFKEALKSSRPRTHS